MNKEYVLFSELNEKIIAVDMTIEEYFKNYDWRYSNVEKILKYMTTHRNKFHAHNDSKDFNNPNFISEDYPITYEDMEKLLLFPLDFCQFSIVMLTGIYKEFTPKNIDDWKNKLNTVRNGNDYNKLRIDISKIVDDLEELRKDINEKPKHKKLVEVIENI